MLAVRVEGCPLYTVRCWTTPIKRYRATVVTEDEGTPFMGRWQAYDLENTLLPSYLGDSFQPNGQSVFAELYKLNVSQI